MSRINKDQWDDFLLKYPDAHILQTSNWGLLKSKYGWNPIFVQNNDSGAQVLFKKLPLGFTIGYIPKGPVGYKWQSLLHEVLDLSQKMKAVVLYVEPDSWENNFHINMLLPGFLPSQFNIQPRKTSAISLKGTQEEWLARMKQKTRYNIRLAEKSGIFVERSSDIGAFNQLITITGERNEFGVHHPDYYMSAYKIFIEKDQCCLLIAKYGQTPLAGLMVFRYGKRAWYFYGASNDIERQRMPTYLLQWEAMQWAASMGCDEYDLWGIPDEDEEYLEKNFTNRSDGLWGVYRFKRGFGGEIRRTAGVFEWVIRPKIKTIMDILLRIRKGNLT